MIDLSDKIKPLDSAATEKNRGETIVSRRSIPKKIEVIVTEHFDS